MTYRLLFTAAMAALLLIGSVPALATDKAKAPPAQTKGTERIAPHQMVDINSAGRAQLKMLPGIGDAEADRIIAARPYPSKAKLVAAKILSDEKYLAIKGRIVAVQKEPPRRPKAQ
jgi:DNA uptake protein ComE-like DNA-binding protein